MNPATQKQLKELTGLSKQAVSKACAAGHITMVISNGKKMVDLDGHSTVEWLQKHPLQTAPIVNQPAPPVIKNTIPINDSNNPSGLASIGENKKLKDEKLEEQIEELKIKNQQKRADLVSKKLAVKVFNRFYGIHENQLKTLGISASPKISAIYNKSNSVKTNELLKFLEKEDDKDLKSEIIKILNSEESDRINSVNQTLEDSIGLILKSIQIEIDKFLKHTNDLKKI